MEKIYSHWKFEFGEAVLYDSKGNEIDRLDLGNLVEEYLNEQGYKINENYIIEA